MNLLITNLPTHCQPQDVLSLLRDFGSIGEVAFIQNQLTAKTTQSVIVEMKHPDQAQMVLRVLDGDDSLGVPLKIQPLKTPSGPPPSPSKPTQEGGEDEVVI